VINMYSQATNSPILKNLCQVKQENHMNKKKLNINLVHHLGLDLDRGRIDEVVHLSIGYL
jgi:Zn-dependent M32 family carboxypeptidase